MLEALGLWNMGDSRFHNLLTSIEGKRIIKKAYASGITVFDTAFSYGNADSFLSSAMKEIQAPRDSFVIWTKVMPVPTLRKKTETSLHRLSTSYVDLLMLHWPSTEECVYTSLRELEALKEEGKTREIGVSNFPLALLEKVAKDFPISYHERPFSLLWAKDYEEEQKLGLKTIAYGPGAFGMLGKEDLPEDDRKNLYFTKEQEYQEINKRLKELAAKYQVTPYAIALSWVKSKEPYALLRGVSNLNQLSYSSVTLTEEEGMELTLLAESLSQKAPSDNIFSHNYLPQ